MDRPIRFYWLLYTVLTPFFHKFQDREGAAISVSQREFFCDRGNMGKVKRARKLRVKSSGKERDCALIYIRCTKQ